jgi:hypothetical protein
MADIKISALPAATTPLAGTEVLPIVQSGVTSKVSIANLTAGRSVSATAVAITGSTSGTATIVTPAVAGTPTITLPIVTGTLATLAGTETLTNKTLTSPVLDTAVTGTAVATQAQQETATATNVLVTPGRQQYHPSAAKAWIKCDNTGTISVSYNVASIADTGTGIATVTLTTAFSSANYSPLASNDGGGGGIFVCASITSASVYRLLAFNTTTQTAQDSGVYFSAAFGDQ